MTIITRFAPSPTGYLHIGNARTAIINWLYAKKHNGKFILRLDDTDSIRNKDEFKDAIIDDLKWLGLKHDIYAQQSLRKDKYLKAKEELIATGRLYPCYESVEELETKRKLLASRGLPPIYDRSALNMTDEQIKNYESEGRKPHYRFLLNNTQIVWQDLIKGEIKFEANNLGDPILIREDGSMTYMLCSTVDDIEFNISHVIRGEDHVSNTAIQMQLFAALNAKPPQCGHLSLIQHQSGKISKRIGGFEIRNLREKFIEPLTILSFIATIGTSKPISIFNSISDLIDNFDLENFSRSPTNYNYEELVRLNHRVVSSYSYNDIKDRLNNKQEHNINEKFWSVVKNNITFVEEVHTWWQICYKPIGLKKENIDYLNLAADLIPVGEFTSTSWSKWIELIVAKTKLNGKALYMPLRLALTGMESGPELQNLLPILGRDEIIKRLKN